MNVNKSSDYTVTEYIKIYEISIFKEHQSIQPFYKI